MCEQSISKMISIDTKGTSLSQAPLDLNSLSGNGPLRNKLLKETKMEEIKEQLEEENYDYAIAIATESELEAGAACGQLALLDGKGTGD